MSDALQRARDWERETLSAIPPETLPAYHLTGGTGWINDPNGFSVYRGEIHLFFQYHPYDTVWGPMHWGHVKSRDFLRWERLPAALAPDEAYDAAGCFSGSALELPDGRHMLMYTGVRPDGDTVRQTQCLAFGDGVDYGKYAGNPVIGPEALPEGGSTVDFRDPKIARENGRFYAVVGDRCADGTGAVLRYESEDAVGWRLLGPLAASRGRYGKMWECPDFFSLDGTDVLLLSYQEMEERGLEFLEGNGTLCLLGRREGTALSEEHAQAIDYGLDFYAPQTVETPDGRRVMIGWMQYWGSVNCRVRTLPFFGQMTVPRELRVKDGRLIQTPVRELEELRTAVVRLRDAALGETTDVPGVAGRCADLTVDLRPGADFRAFALTVAEGDGYGTVVRFDPAKNTVTVDRSKSGFPPEVRNVREFAVRDRGGALRLRLLLDRWSLELFVNDGEQAASFTLYTPPEAEGITFAAQGEARMDLDFYTLEMER